MTKAFAHLALLTVLAGCASQDPRLHNLSAHPGLVRGSVRQVIVILAPAIPRYLQRQEIVRTTGDNTRKLADNDWWDEPLRQMVPRVLVADLSQRLPQCDVVTDAGLGPGGATARVEIDIERFDGNAGGVVLAGHVAVQGNTGQHTLDALRVTVPVSAAGVAGQVEAMSIALGQAADEIAARLGDAAIYRQPATPE